MVTPPRDPLLRLLFESDAESPRQVRKAFATHFAGHECLEVMLLCLSEVVTNAVLHGGTGGSVVVLRLAEGLGVEVTDGSGKRPLRREFRELSPTGRGLHILDKLSDRWGVADGSG